MLNGYISLTAGFLLLSGTVFSQTQKSEIADMNKDGVSDTLRWETDYGTSFGYTRYVLSDGKTGSRYEVDQGGCFCELLDIIPITDPMMLRQNQWVIRVFEQKWNREKRFSAPDPSLHWLISGYLNNRPLAHNPYYSQIISPSVKWETGTMYIPPSYSLQIKGDTLNRLARFFRDNYLADWEETNQGLPLKQAWLVYNAHNLSPKNTNNPRPDFVLADSSSKYQIYTTAHGVVVKVGSRYRWLFISDAMLTSGPEKLRWYSIKSARLMGDLVIIHHFGGVSGGEHIFIADILSGKVGRLILDPSDPDYGIEDLTYFLQGEQLRLNIPFLEDSPKKYCIPDLLQALKE
ncbi:MAG: hypothetical protein SF052_23360 [Bacteroidia bacterium]|nr:hypothetical protein [Bacteroidia bacterium]